jgi:O-antigen/teichoic acid export membrane protein
MLTVTGRQRARAVSVGAGLLVTGVAILVLGARHGAAGAVVALTCGEVAALAVAWAALRDVREPVSQLS